MVVGTVEFIAADDANAVLFEHHRLHEQFTALVVKVLSEHMVAGLEDLNAIVGAALELDPLSRVVTEVVQHEAALSVGHDFDIAWRDSNNRSGNGSAVAVDDLSLNQMRATGHHAGA